MIVEEARLARVSGLGAVLGTTTEDCGFSTRARATIVLSASSSGPSR